MISCLWSPLSGLENYKLFNRKLKIFIDKNNPFVA